MKTSQAASIDFLSPKSGDTFSFPLAINRNRVTLINWEDWERVSPFKWFAKADDRRLYVLRTTDSMPIHRIIMRAVIGEVIDHKNGNPLDNRRSNLRPCLQQENSYNRKLNKSSVSGKKGISWHKQSCKWSARINYLGSTIHLGYYQDLNDASISYDAASKWLHGEFANTNASVDGDTADILNT